MLSVDEKVRPVAQGPRVIVRYEFDEDYWRAAVSHLDRGWREGEHLEAMERAHGLDDSDPEESWDGCLRGARLLAHGLTRIWDLDRSASDRPLASELWIGVRRRLVSTLGGADQEAPASVGTIVDNLLPTRLPRMRDPSGPLFADELFDLLFELGSPIPSPDDRLEEEDWYGDMFRLIAELEREMRRRAKASPVSPIKFHLDTWRSAVYETCQPPKDPTDMVIWEMQFEMEADERGKSAFSDSVDLDVARQLLVLIARLWDCPGERVHREIPESVLWQWLRRQVIGLVSKRQISAIGQDGYGDDDPYIKAGYRLRSLIPRLPVTLSERQSLYSDHVESIDRDLAEASDVLQELIVNTGALYEPSRPWPVLPTLKRLVDQLIDSRSEGAPPLVGETVSVRVANPSRLLRTQRLTRQPPRRPQDRPITPPSVTPESSSAQSGVTPIRVGRRPANFDRAVAEETCRRFTSNHGRAPSPAEVYKNLPPIEQVKGMPGTFRKPEYYGGWSAEPGWGKVESRSNT